MMENSPVPIDYKTLVRAPVPKKAGLTFLVLRNEGFAEMKAAFVRDKEEKTAIWRREREAKKKKTSSEPERFS